MVQLIRRHPTPTWGPGISLERERQRALESFRVDLAKETFSIRKLKCQFQFEQKNIVQFETTQISAQISARILQTYLLLNNNIQCFYLSKHQLYEYPAAVLQSLSPVSLLGLAGGGGVVCGGHLGRVLHSHWSTSLEIMCSDWLNLTLLMPRSMP